MRLERLNNLTLNTVTPKFVDIFVFFGTAVEGTNVITSHKCNKGHKCDNKWSQM